MLPPRRFRENLLIIFIFSSLCAGPRASCTKRPDSALGSNGRRRSFRAHVDHRQRQGPALDERRSRVLYDALQLSIESVLAQYDG